MLTGFILKDKQVSVVTFYWRNTKVDLRFINSSCKGINKWFKVCKDVLNVCPPFMLLLHWDFRGSEFQH